MSPTRTLPKSELNKLSRSSQVTVVVAAMEQFKGHPRLPKFAVPKRYDLRLKPDLAACKFGGSVDIDFDIVADTKFIVLNAAELSFNAGSVFFAHGCSSKVFKPTKAETFFG